MFDSSAFSNTFPRHVDVLLMPALVLNWNEHVAIGIIRCPEIGCVPLAVTYIFKVSPELRRSDYCKVISWHVNTCPIRRQRPDTWWCHYSLSSLGALLGILRLGGCPTEASLLDCRIKRLVSAASQPFRLKLLFLCKIVHHATLLGFSRINTSSPPPARQITLVSGGEGVTSERQAISH